MTTRFIIAVAIVLSIYLFIAIYKGFVRVPEGKVGIVEKYGAFSRIIHPGKHFIFPLRDRIKLLSIEDVIKIDQSLAIDYEESYHIVIDVSYHVDDIQTFAYGKAPDQIISRIRKTIQTQNTKHIKEDIVTNLMGVHDLWGITIHRVDIHRIVK